MDIELDSMILVSMIKKQVKPPWTAWYEMRKIIKLLESLNYTVNHVYREGNSAADWLAN